MSENVERVRRWLDALSREDFESALELVHRDVVLVPPGDQPLYRGTESLQRWMQPDAFIGLVVEPLETIAVKDRSVLSKHRAQARGRASGIEIDMVSWSVWTFDQEGLITRIEIYQGHEKEKALEAARLSD